MVLRCIDSADRNVPTCQHPDRAINIAHRNDASVDLGHDVSRLLNSLVSVGNTNVSRQDFAHSHAELLCPVATR